MKKNVIYLFMLICSLSVFVSCKDDDDNEGIDAGTNIAGTYKGGLTVALGNPDAAGKPINQKIKIIKIDGEHVQLEINNFIFSSLPVGDIVVKDIPVVKNGEQYELQPTVTNLKLALPIGDVTVSITSGIINGNDLALKIKVVQLSIPLDIYVGFSGSKMTDKGSSEAEILKFGITDAWVVGEPAIGDNTITIYVADSAKNENLKFKPAIEVSPFATVSPASGVEQDFSSAVTYTVTSEDGTTQKYTVTCQKVGKYDFEEWFPNEKTPDYEEVANGWGTSNAGVAMIKEMSDPNEGRILYPADGEYVVTKTTDAKTGKLAAKIMTVNTTGFTFNMPGMLPDIPKITSGTLYLGKFELDYTSPLKSTHFGIPFTAKPLRFKGNYKYKSGDTYHTAVDGKCYETTTSAQKDQCAIYSVLYEISGNDANETLDGTNILDPKNGKTVATAILEDGSEKSAYTSFDLEFKFVEGKVYDSNKKYKLAVVFSSSKDGDKFCGAPGSTLLVDDVEIISE